MIKKNESLYLFGFSLVSFILLYCYWRGLFIISEPESYNKIELIKNAYFAYSTGDLSLANFRIFGHPPLLNFISGWLYDFFGISIVVVKSLICGVLITCIITTFFILNFHLKNALKSSLLTLLLFSFPLLVESSFNFFHELPSLLFLNLAILSLQRNKTFLTALFLTMTVFNLESLAIYPASWSLYYYLRKDWKKGLVLSLPLLLLGLYFFYVSLYQDNSHHYPALNNFRNNENYFAESLSQIKRILYVYQDGLISIVFFATFWIKFKPSFPKIKQTYFFVLPALIQIIFFLFFIDEKTSRNLIIANFSLWFFIIFFAFKEKKERFILYPLLLFVLVTNAIKTRFLTFKWNQARNDTYKEIGRKVDGLSSNGAKMTFFDTPTQVIFSKSFYGFVSKDYPLTLNPSETSVVINCQRDRFFNPNDILNFKKDFYKIDYSPYRANDEISIYLRK